MSLHQELLIAGNLIGGPCDHSVSKSVIRSPYDNSIVGTAAEGDGRWLSTAIESAHESFQSWRGSSFGERQVLLRAIASEVRARQDELTNLLVAEVGKPIRWARAEVQRLAITFDLAAGELDSFGTQTLSLAFDPRGIDHRLTVDRKPLGVVLGIVPYNWPFNLSAHKIAPALATGNTVVLKASPLAPLTTLALASLIHEVGCPDGVLNSWHGPTEAAKKMLTDPRIAMVSFTGSVEVGWKIKQLLPDRLVTLELGGDATVIVDRDIDQERAAARIVLGAYGYAGQICISIQHCLVHVSIADEFLSLLTRLVRECPTGNPNLETIVCGPLISAQSADRIEALIDEALELGATALVRGKREGNFVFPTLLGDVPASARLYHEEAFGPVLTYSTFRTPDEAIARVNASPYGIHCGLFTRDQRFIAHAYRDLEVSGLVVGDVPTLRFDNMPYGGVKRSGFGREGVRYAMEEMTRPMAMIIAP